MSLISKRDRFSRFVAFGVGTVFYFRDGVAWQETTLNGKPIVYCKICLAYGWDREREKRKYQLAILWEYADRPFANAIKSVECWDTVQFQGIIELYPDLAEEADVRGNKGQIHIEEMQVFHCGCPKTFEVQEQQIKEKRHRGNEEEFPDLPDDENYEF